MTTPWLVSVAAAAADGRGLRVERKVAHGELLDRLTCGEVPHLKQFRLPLLLEGDQAVGACEIQHMDEGVLQRTFLPRIASASEQVVKQVGQVERIAMEGESSEGVGNNESRYDKRPRHVEQGT
jgi:hypothetical protein